MTEKWFPVTGYEDLYLVSNLGRVRSLDRTVVHADNRIRSFPARILSPRKNSKTGYHQVGLHRSNKNKMVYVHRLVADAFIPNPENKRCVNHKDGARSHNSVENLEWSTHSENTMHAHATGLAKALRGEEVWNAKVTYQSAQALRDDVWAVIETWAKANDVHTQAAWDIIAGRNWIGSKKVA
jgi:hypothetical protein